MSEKYESAHNLREKRRKKPGVPFVVLTLTHTVATMQSVVTGQAPINLERKIISGGKQIKTKDNTHNT